MGPKLKATLVSVKPRTCIEEDRVKWWMKGAYVEGNCYRRSVSHYAVFD